MGQMSVARVAHLNPWHSLPIFTHSKVAVSKFFSLTWWQSVALGERCLKGRDRQPEERLLRMVRWLQHGSERGRPARPPVSEYMLWFLFQSWCDDVAFHNGQTFGQKVIWVSSARNGGREVGALPLCSRHHPQVPGTSFFFLNRVGWLCQEWSRTWKGWGRCWLHWDAQDTCPLLPALLPSHP